MEASELAELLKAHMETEGDTKVTIDGYPVTSAQVMEAMEGHPAVFDLVGM